MTRKALADAFNQLADAAAKEWAREYGPDYALLAAYQAEGR